MNDRVGPERRRSCQWRDRCQATAHARIEGLEYVICGSCHLWKPRTEGLDRGIGQKLPSMQEEPLSVDGSHARSLTGRLPVPCTSEDETHMLAEMAGAPRVLFVALPASPRLERRVAGSCTEAGVPLLVSTVKGASANFSGDLQTGGGSRSQTY